MQDIMKLVDDYCQTFGRFGKGDCTLGEAMDARTACAKAIEKLQKELDRAEQNTRHWVEAHDKLHNELESVTSSQPDSAASVLPFTYDKGY